MSTQDEAEGHDDEDLVTTRKKLGGKRLILIAVAAFLLLGGGAAGLYFSGILGPKGEETVDAEPGHEEPAKEEEHASDAKDEKKEAHGGGKEKGGESAKQNVTMGPAGVVYYQLPDFLVNLNNERRTSFLKMSVTLELATMEDSNQIDTVQPRLVDNMNTYLRELRPADLNGSAGVHRLREELLLRVNQTAHPAKINDILFKEILVQ